MSIRIIPVPLARRDASGRRNLSHQAIAEKVEAVIIREGLPTDARLLGHYVLDAPDIESINPHEHVPGIHFLFEIPNEVAD